MAIQTCSEVFAVLMQMDGHASFSADNVTTLLNSTEKAAAYSQDDFLSVVSNDRTILPFQR